MGDELKFYAKHIAIERTHSDDIEFMSRNLSHREWI